MPPPTSFDFDAAVKAPFRMQPGLRRLQPGSRQLSALTPDSPAFAEKLAVLSTAPDEALLRADGFDPLPALRALVEEAAIQCPGVLEASADGAFGLAIGWHVHWNGSALHGVPGAHERAGACLVALPAAQRLAALLSLSLHEDLAIVDAVSATLPWLAVCLPSHWAPRDKVGRSFAAVHGPVADNATLLAAGEHLVRLVCQPQRWERFVWTITPHAGLDRHPQRHATVSWARLPGEIASQAHWRTEHQTFIPLPSLQQALFTIHVDVQPLVEAIATPEQAESLHAALSTMSDAVLAYRGLGPARDPLLAWLAERAAA
ncbi:heme-dependent oxidative N-demethylase subunit alpha family protein [Methylibium sp.]|uniref:heme-dependent oxidative N-demethylase subunit alpha family protein n=1 Tax=Methylibium sp. TaxID=2067992 RepID=UPI0017AB0330|nr:heme-dependent oxidative N-demethylase subunit alpha family protein [Methylibium sp.]MBA3591048.1 DUF3445 domain-containing protein [Methylibium sp.]